MEQEIKQRVRAMHSSNQVVVAENLLNLPVGLEEVRTQVDIEEIGISGESLKVFREREHMNTLSILNVRASGNRDNITKANTKVVSHDAIAANSHIFALLIRQNNADGISSLLTLQKHGITAEKLKLLHLRGARATRNCHRWSHRQR